MKEVLDNFLISKPHGSPPFPLLLDPARTATEQRQNSRTLSLALVLDILVNF